MMATCEITICFNMTTSSNENIFPVTGSLWGESTGHRWIPLTKLVTRSFDFFSSEPENTVEQTIDTPVIWDANTLFMTSL